MLQYVAKKFHIPNFKDTLLWKSARKILYSTQ